MDSALAVVPAQESARRYFDYRAFYAPQRAYTRMLSELVPGEGVEGGVARGIDAEPHVGEQGEHGPLQRCDAVGRLVVGRRYVPIHDRR